MKIDKEVVKEVFATITFMSIMFIIVFFVLFVTKDPFYGGNNNVNTIEQANGK